MADAGGTRVDRTIISVEESPQNKRTEESIRDITREIADQRFEVGLLNDETRKLSKAMRNGEDVVEDFITAEIALARAQDKLRKSESERRKALAGTNIELEKRAALLSKQRRQQQALGAQAREFGDIESRTRALTGAVGFVGGARGQQAERFVNIGAEGLASVEAIKLLKLELPKMAANMGLAQLSTKQLKIGLGVAALATTAVVVAIKLIGDASKEAQQAAQAQIETQRQLSELRIGDLTTAEIKAEKQAIEELNVIRRNERRVLEETARELLDGLGDLEKYGEATGLANQGIDDYTTRIDELTKDIDSSAAVFVELNNALDDATTAANDAAAAERELASERETEVAKRIKKIQRDLKLESDALQRAATFTEEQRQARLQEIDALRALEDATQEKLKSDIDRGKIDGQLADDAFAASEVRQSALRQEQTFLNTIVAEGVAVREEEAAAAELLEEQLKLTEQATKDAAKALEANLKLTLATGAKIAKFNEATAEKAEDMALKLLRDQEDFDRERAEDIADFNRDLADLDRDFFEDRADILADTAADLDKIASERQSVIDDANQEALDAERDHRKELRDIQRDANKAIGDAAANLDAQALLAAKEERKERVEEENERFKEESGIRERERKERLKELERERRERIRDGNQRLQDLRRQHQRERSERIADFNRQLFLEDQNRALALSRQQEDWNIEDQRRRSHFGLVESETDAHLDKLLLSTQDGFVAIQAAWDAGMGGLGDGGAVGAPLIGGSTGPVGAPLVPFIPTPSPLGAGANTFNQISMPISVGGDAQSAQMARIVRDLVDQRIGQLTA